MSLSIEADAGLTLSLSATQALHRSVAEVFRGENEREERLEVELRIVGEEAIRRLNREQRGVDAVTDILSFPMLEYEGETEEEGQLCDEALEKELDPETGKLLLGALALCLPRAREQALRFGHSLERELCFLVAHGLLHLLGYDHENPEEESRMAARAEEALRRAGLSRAPVEADAEALLEAARAARQNAYAPYSQFQVGAALLCADGMVYTGANIENAAFGAGLCAERSALFAAASAGERDFLAIAIAGAKAGTESEAPCWPCGLCRQALYEFAPGLCVLAAGTRGPAIEKRLSELLPCGFSAADMEE